MNDDFLRYMAERERAQLEHEASVMPDDASDYDDDLEFEPVESEEFDDSW
jgi:hypothetical protein